jgi:hypothetical protein
MTEAEWLASTSPHAMLDAIGEGIDPRKAELFACALRLPLSRAGVGALDDYERPVAAAFRREGFSLDLPAPLKMMATQARAWARRAHLNTGDAVALHAGLLRDVFGNPYRAAAIGPALRTPLVASLAQAAYEERLLPSGELDAARLAVLADALEEAGATGGLLGGGRGPWEVVSARAARSEAEVSGHRGEGEAGRRFCAGAPARPVRRAFGR